MLCVMNAGDIDSYQSARLKTTVLVYCFRRWGLEDIEK